MRGVYTAEIKISALAAAKTLLLLEAAAGKLIEILSASVVQVGSNLTNQQLECSVTRVTTLGTPAGTSVTPNPEEPGDQASTTTVLGNLTAEPTAYGVNADHQGATSLGGYQYQPVPEERGLDGSGASLGLRLLNAPTSADFVVQLKFRDVG